MADQVAHLAHLNARDTTLAFASRAPQADIARVKARMGREMPWYTMTDEFDADFGVDEWHGTNAFIRDGDQVYRTYFTNNRGDEALGSTWSYLDITALAGRRSGRTRRTAIRRPRLLVVALARRVRRLTRRRGLRRSRCQACRARTGSLLARRHRLRRRARRSCWASPRLLGPLRSGR